MVRAHIGPDDIVLLDEDAARGVTDDWLAWPSLPAGNWPAERIGPGFSWVALGSNVPPERVVKPEDIVWLEERMCKLARDLVPTVVAAVLPPLQLPARGESHAG